MSQLVTKSEAFPFQLDEFYLDLQEDGSKISILDTETIADRPFPGLRPFKTSEFQLFKGRDGQAEELIKRLRKNHFLAVIGSSGTGKSSLVRAGLIPQLFGGYLHKAGNKWNIAVCRPGKDPVENLAIALSSVKSHSKDKSLINENYKIIEPLLSGSIYGILDVDELLTAGIPPEDKPNLLIIIDQFEELFRFNRTDLGKADIESHFVNLLLKASLNPESSVYVIITMRSEFLGDCVKYRGLPEAINEGQYLVPQLSRNQVKEVIEGPVHLARKEIDTGLVELLINEIDEHKLKENLDQLPILQHALMRTYQEAKKVAPKSIISYDHYKRTGGMELALANHAEQIYKTLGEKNDESNPSKKQQIAKLVFQALTDASREDKGGRRPTELSKIYAMARSVHATEKEVDEVINHFRDVETSFIMPPVNTPLYPQLILDISHESLMRNWQRLNTWLKEEAELGKLYKTLNERREYNEQKDKSDFVRGILLKELIEWRDGKPASAVWASRYHTIKDPVNDTDQKVLDKNIAFLNKSQTEVEREYKKKERGKQRFVGVVTTAAILSFCLAVWAFTERNLARKNAEDARTHASKVVGLNEIAKQQTAEAVRLKDEAISLRKKAEALAATIKEKSEEKVQAEVNAGIQSRIANELKEAGIIQKARLEKQIIWNGMPNQKFYVSPMLGDSTKTNIVNALFYEPLRSTHKINEGDYIDVPLLEGINQAVEARERFKSNTEQGLKMAKKVWNKYPNNYVQGIITAIFDNNLFFKQSVQPIPISRANPNPHSLVVSKDHKEFAFSAYNKIVTGFFGKDSLRINSINEFGAKGKSGSVTNEKATPTRVVALPFSGSRMLYFDDNNQLAERDIRYAFQSDAIAGLEDLEMSAVSPDGSLLVTATKNGVVKFWKIPMSADEKMKSLKTDSSAYNEYLTKLVFSPDSKKLLKIFDNYRLEVWDLSTFTRLPAFDRLRHITYANFTSKGDFILAVTLGNTIELINNAGENKGSILFYSLTGDDSREYSFDKIQQLSLASDFSKLLVKHDQEYILYEPKLTGADSLLKVGKRIEYTYGQNLRGRKLISNNGMITAATFVDTNRIVSVNRNGFVSLWDAATDLSSLNKAFKSVSHFTVLTVQEKIAEGEISFSDLLSEKNIDVLTKAAAYYDDAVISDGYEAYKDDKLKAKQLYSRLMLIDTPAPSGNHVYQIVTINNELYQLGKQNHNYELIVEAAWDNVRVLEGDLKNNPDKQKLSDYYWRLSYYQLFIPKYNKNVIESVRRGRELYPLNDGMVTNLALAYLLTRQFDNADSIYNAYKDATYASRPETRFKESFIKDFDDLIKAGVITQQKKDIYDHMKFIRKEILKE